MDPTQQNDPSTWQTLASVFAGGLGGYVDAQNHQPVYVATPAPQTQYGYAGIAQSTPTNSLGGLSPTVLLVGVIVVAAVFMLKK